PLSLHDALPILSELADAHGCGLAVDRQPLVSLGVSPLSHSRPSYSRNCATNLSSASAPSPAPIRGRTAAPPPRPAPRGLARPRRPCLRPEMMAVRRERARWDTRGRRNGFRW